MRAIAFIGAVILIELCSGLLSAQTPDGAPRRIAVLPIEVVSDRPASSELADTVYDAVLNALVSITGAEVVDDEEVLPYTDAGLSPDVIAEALGIVLIEGSISEQTRDGTFWLELSTYALGYRGSQGGVVGFLDPTQTYLTICTDSEPIDMDTEALLDFAILQLVATLESLLFQKPPGPYNPCTPVEGPA